MYSVEVAMAKMNAKNHLPKTQTYTHTQTHPVSGYCINSCSLSNQRYININREIGIREL